MKILHHCLLGNNLALKRIAEMLAQIVHLQPEMSMITF